MCATRLSSRAQTNIITAPARLRYTDDAYIFRPSRGSESLFCYGARRFPRTPHTVFSCSNNTTTTKMLHTHFCVVFIRCDWTGIFLLWSKHKKKTKRRNVLLMICERVSKSVGSLKVNHVARIYGLCRGSECARKK